MATNKLSSLWVNHTSDIFSVSVPVVAWETIAKEVIQLTDEITFGETRTPATYRTWAKPTNVNHLGADIRDVAVGYNYMSYLGDIYSIIAVNDDDSLDISDDLFCGYGPPCGRPAMIYSLTSPGKPPVVVTTKWVDEDLQCLLDANNDNTGIQVGTSRKMQLNKTTGLYEYTGEETPILRTNLISCPLPIPPPADPFRAGQYVGLVFDSNNVVDFNFNFNVSTPINTLTIAGRNFLFLSIPKGHNFAAVDITGYNMRAEFGELPIGTDNKLNFQDNDVWQMKPKYGTEKSGIINVLIF